MDEQKRKEKLGELRNKAELLRRLRDEERDLDGKISQYIESIEI